jgi:hypothetical protein
LAVTDSGGPIRILLGIGDGTLRAAGDYLDRVWGMDMAAADLNGDGTLDLAVLDYAGGSVRVLLGNGDGTFQAAPSVYPSDGGVHTSVAVGDMNADGTLDLVVGGSHTFSGSDEYGGWSATFGEMNVLLGHGDGTFSAAASMLMNHFPGDITLADLNGDSNLDVAFTGGSSNYGSALQVLLGMGNGGLQYGATYALNRPQSVAAADFNADGKTDLVVGNNTLYLADADTLSLFLGQGNGTFQAPRTIASGGGAGVAVGDFNRDGWTDIAVAKPYGDRANVLLGLGDGTFRAPEAFAVGSSPIGLVVVDLDSDGYADLATANSGSNDASVVLNDGIWSLLPPPPPPASISISDVTKQEGNGKKKTLFTFTVTLSAAYDQAVTLSYRTVNGTATTGDGDYLAKTGTLTFAPGETTKTITIEVKGDNKKEVNEMFYLDLFGNSSNSLFTKNRGSGTILNDD